MLKLHKFERSLVCFLRTRAWGGYSDNDGLLHTFSIVIIENDGNNNENNSCYFLFIDDYDTGDDFDENHDFYHDDG